MSRRSAPRVDRHRPPKLRPLAEPVYTTRPTMPALSDFTRYLEQIWERRWLTNNGLLHQEFEARLAEHLGVEQISLFCNGTIALLVAIQALAIRGEVITTPFTFPATVHVLHWNRIRPVFCDIEETTFNIDPALIEARIGPRTTAILPVHVFGTPCDVRAIDAIASRRKLKVIYDAAHAFGVRYMGRSLASYGHLAVLSFHATKLFSTIEGGAIVSRTKTDKRRVDFLKNFGFADEETIIGPGINGKMNELQAAYGLLQLKQVDQEIARRLALTEQYRSLLRHVRGVRVLPDTPDTTRNGAYFPILIDRDEYGRTRDELYSEMKRYGIHPRKYFHPLLSSVACYRSSPGAGAKQLPVARRVAQRVLCLPIYGTLRRDTVSTICDLIAAYGRP